MRSLRLALLAAVGLLLLLGRVQPAAEPSALEADEQVLKRAKIGTDAAALAQFFRDRTLTDAKRKRILALIEELRDNTFQVREKANQQLEAEGELALPLLRQAMVGAELELVRRAEKIIAAVKLTDPEVASAAARQLARQKPDDTAALLLAYLAAAPVDASEDIRLALSSIAVRNGHPDKALTQALADEQPWRRAAAVEALIRAGTVEERQALRKFLKDSDATVRLRAALATIEREDKDAVPVIIALLVELPLEQTWQAEDMLCRLAGEQTPAVSLGRDEETRKKCRDAWAIWWVKNGPALDLAKRENAPRLRGYTLLAQYAGEESDRVVELGMDGKPRWQIIDLQYPVDAQVLAGNRVLIAEHSGRRVSERNLKGEILWKREFATGPITCQRLPNGNTLMATHTQVIEVDPTGKEVFTYNTDNFRLCGVHKPRNGPLAILTSEGNCVRLDAQGKELKSFKTGHDVSWVSGMECLPNGRVLVPLRGTSKVAEYDAEGKVVWEADAPGPKAASRLPNGHTLVASFDNHSVIELDRAGKVVWEYKDSYHQYRAYRR